MNNVDLTEFLRKISYFQKQKKDIEEKLNSLKKAVEIVYPDINLSLELKKINSDKQNTLLNQEKKKGLKSVSDYIKCTLKEGDWTSKEDLFNILNEFGKEWKEKTITANLSKMVSSAEIEKNVEGDTVYFRKSMEVHELCEYVTLFG